MPIACPTKVDPPTNIKPKCRPHFSTNGNRPQAITGSAAKCTTYVNICYYCFSTFKIICGVIWS